MKSLRELSPYEEPPRGPMRGASADANPIRRMPVVNPEQTFFHFDLLRALELHRGLAVGIFLAAVLLSGAYLARRWHNFKAESLVYVQPAPPHLLENAQTQSWPFDANTYESYIQQQIHNVTREDVLAGAVRRIPGFQGAKESEQAAADRLGGNILVDRVSTGYQISITATAGSAEEAAQMANAVAESFIDSTTREMRSGDKERIALLAEERDRVSKELAGDRTEQEALNKQLGVASVGASTPDPYDDQIAAIRAELVKARTDRDQAAAKLTATAGGGLSSAALDAAAEDIVAADPGLVSMKTALNKRRSDLISQMANLTPQHPLYRQDTDELAKINSSLEAMSKDLRAKAGAQIQQKLKSDLERTAGVEDRLNAQLAQLTRQAGGATPRLQRASELATDIARLQARYAAVDEQYRNLTIDNAAPGAVYLSAPAIAPLHADRKKIYRNALIVLLAGIVFALAAALIAHNLDPRIYIAADVERVLGFAPMALLPDLYEVGTGVSEEYMLRLAAAVEHAHQQGQLNSCLFTGVAPGAGTTTVATRVSNMLRAMGRSTALVDAVGTSTEESIDPGTGLMHVPPGSRSTALLQQMTGANRESIVVTDTAPLLISGETEYLARFVDSAIVVIESGTTTKAQLREVAQTLERLDVSAVGFVLNRISMAKGNPAFRHSVHAVEKHLKAQARSYERKRSADPAPAAEVAEHPAAEHSDPHLPVPSRAWKGVSEPLAGIANPDLLAEDEPKYRRGFVPARETMLGYRPRNGAAEDFVPRFTAVDEPSSWETENFMPLENPKHAAAEDARHPRFPGDLQDGEADGFLPWEVDMHARVPTLFAEYAPHPSETVSPRANGEASQSQPAVPESARESSHQVAGSPAQEMRTVQPAMDALNAEFLQESLERATAEVSESSLFAEGTPDREFSDDRLHPDRETFVESFQSAPPTDKPIRNAPAAQPVPAATSAIAPSQAASTIEEPAPVAQNPIEAAPSPEPSIQAAPVQAEAPLPSPPADPIEKPENVAANLISGWNAAKARPARGREGLHVVLGGRSSASLTGEEVPQAWRELLRSEAEIPDPTMPGEAAAIARSLATPEHRADPFAEMRQAGAEREPLKEWWEQLAAPRQRTSAAAASPQAAPANLAQETTVPTAANSTPAAVSEQDESLNNAANRLSGLRNLLVSLGIQTLHQGMEQRKTEAQGDARFPRTPERAIDAQPVSSEGNDAAPAESVTARGEIIPPLSQPPASERVPKDPKTPIKSPRVWETPDDVDTLPARKGQYRRNH